MGVDSVSMEWWRGRGCSDLLRRQRFESRSRVWISVDLGQIHLGGFAGASLRRCRCVSGQPRCLLCLPLSLCLWLFQLKLLRLDLWVKKKSDVLGLCQGLPVRSVFSATIMAFDGLGSFGGLRQLMDSSSLLCLCLPSGPLIFPPADGSSTSSIFKVSEGI